MTPDEFRSIALSQTGAVEQSHMGHPDFRASGKIFATLGYPDDAHAMVKLDPEEQRVFVGRAPEMFRPIPGTWGLRGATQVILGSAEADLVTEAVRSAFRAVTARKPPKRSRL